jgi:UDP-2,4-diacetamido-2,4,6-trideoxy-beta-L-altropyranose hydrolase
MSGPILLIRADANAEIGVGHVMRCVALAQAWQQTGGRAVFALAEGANELGDRLRSEGADVVAINASTGSDEDAASTNEMCRKFGAVWLVIDGYHFGPDYHSRINARETRVLVMDDDESPKNVRCDILLNSDPRATSECYADMEHKSVVLLGSQYALLRREFLNTNAVRADVPKIAERVLVTLGGGDAENVTLDVVEALNEVTGVNLRVTVVVGASNPNKDALQSAAERSVHNATIVSDVRNMPALMNEADLAITAGGGTCYELAFMGVPMFLITTAGNHERAVKAFASGNAAFAVGWFHTLSKESLAAWLQTVVSDHALRRRLVTNARNMVDGKGAERVVEAMFRVCKGAGLD